MPGSVHGFALLYKYVTFKSLVALQFNLKTYFLSNLFIFIQAQARMKLIIFRHTCHCGVGLPLCRNYIARHEVDYHYLCITRQRLIVHNSL